MVYKNKESGFTVVEVVVTLVITALFITFFFQMYLMSESQRVKVARHATASNMAYANLRKITTRETVETAVTCDDTTAGAGNVNNVVRNPSAAGTNIPTSLFNPESTDGYTQTMRAFFPLGCGLNMPVKIESSVTYNTTPQETVTHASYVN